MKKKIIIIGAGLAGLEFANQCKKNGMTDFLLLEKNDTISKKNSWKSFPDVVKEFELQDCIAREITHIYFRASDIPNRKIIYDNMTDNTCVVLDADKIHKKYENWVGDHVILNSLVTQIIPIIENQDIVGYKIVASGEEYECDYLVDASGCDNIADKLLPQKGWYLQKAYYPCYGKRFTNCKVELMPHDAIMDFDDVKTYFGCWCYPVTDDIVEIGMARFERDFDIDNNREKWDAQLDALMQLPKYREVFKDAKYKETIYGYIPLLPRLEIYKDRIYYVGDAKGAVPYSGYGIENALRSGKAAGLSFLHQKKYNYFITPPCAGLAILNLLWVLTPDEVKRQAQGVMKLNSKDRMRFFTGRINRVFFLKAIKITRQLKNRNFIKMLPKGAIWRILFNKMPIEQDYAEFLHK